MTTLTETDLPDVAAPATAAFWEGTAAGELRVQACDDCGYLRWPPGPSCPNCLSAETTWTAVDTGGTVWSYAVYHRALDPAFKDDVPYTVVLVELDAGPRIYGRYLGGERDLSAGTRVRADFRELGTGVYFPDWRRDS
jgi:uncharacterized OB-fold protein